MFMMGGPWEPPCFFPLGGSLCKHGEDSPQFRIAGEQEILAFVKSTGLSPGRKPPSASSRVGFTWNTSPEQLESFGILRMGCSGEGVREQRGGHRVLH